MASVFTHPVVALALMPPVRDLTQWKKIVWAGMLLTILPDIDVISFYFNIPYEHILGHRGITHSVCFAFVFSFLTSHLFSTALTKKFTLVWAYLFFCLVSHGVLDAMTNGGKGVAFLAPFSNERYFLPFRPLEVSTLDITRFFTMHGVRVIGSELIWIWPAFFLLYVLLSLKFRASK